MTAKDASLGSPERVALCLRVSSEEQRERETIEIQRAFLQEYCRLYSLEVVQIYADDGVSGTVPLHERPEGRRLLEDAKEGKFSTLLATGWIGLAGPSWSPSTPTIGYRNPAWP